MPFLNDSERKLFESTFLLITITLAHIFSRKLKKNSGQNNGTEEISLHHYKTLAIAVFIAEEINSTRTVIKTLKSKGDLLHWLVTLGYPYVVEEALHIVENVNATNEKLETPLHVAISTANLEIVKLLLDNGADVNSITEKGESPLHIAAKLNNMNKSDIIEVLLRFNPDVNCGDRKKVTALNHLCHIDVEKDLKSIYMLLMAGADPSANNSDGFNALDYMHTTVLQDYNNEDLYKTVKYDRELNEKVMEILFIHIILEISVTNTTKYRYFLHRSHSFHRKWTNLYQEILDSIEEMKTVDLGDTVTLYDLAVASVEEIRNIFRNKNVMWAALQSEFVSCFPLDMLIKKKIELACRRLEFGYACLPYINEILEGSLPKMCVEKIMLQLDEKAITDILICYTRKTGERVRASVLYEFSLHFQSSEIVE